MKTRKIGTGLTSHDNKNWEVLQSVLGQLSDGIWENSPACTCYWVCADIGEHDYEVTINVSEKWYENWSGESIKNRYRDMTDDKILEYFARKIDQIIKIFKDYHKNSIPNINDDTKILYMGYNETITIGDAKRVRKTLLNTAKNIRLLTSK